MGGPAESCDFKEPGPTLARAGAIGQKKIRAERGPLRTHAALRTGPYGPLKSACWPVISSLCSVRSCRIFLGLLRLGTTGAPVGLPLSLASAHLRGLGQGSGFGRGLAYEPGLYILRARRPNGSGRRCLFTRRRHHGGRTGCKGGRGKNDCSQAHGGFHGTISDDDSACDASREPSRCERRRASGFTVRALP